MPWRLGLNADQKTMCGINGIVSTAAIVDAPTRIKAMNDALIHRGPDGEGQWFAEGVALGHRRLAVIDLSERGQQPMFNADGSLVMVCNGEIYNYRALRHELERQGNRFCSQTDVEVILHLYERYGLDCVDYLTGMFAFAIWDQNKRQLFLARDRIGEKPLYYIEAANGIVFSSEVKGLLRLPWVKREVCEEAVACLPVYQSVPAPYTFFKNIKALPPASRMIWQDGRSRVERYWALDFSRKRNWAWDDAMDRYGELLKDSVAGCLESDVPVGITLSGGVDSSSIAAEAVALRDAVKTYCVGHKGPQGRDPEFTRSQRVAELLGTEHMNLEFHPSGLDQLPRIIAQYDQPLASYPVIFADPLMKLIREQGIKVVLNGNAADELFGGYRGYNRVALMGWLRGILRWTPRFALNLLPKSISERVGWMLTAARADICRWRAIQMDSTAQNTWLRLFAPEFVKKIEGFSPGAMLAGYARECRPQSLLDAAMYTDLMLYHHHGHGIIADIAGMTHGLEVRAPFLNHKMIEFAASLPQRMKVPNVLNPDRNKPIMKRHLARYLPREIVNVPKMGFGYGVDVKGFMKGPWRKAVEASVLHGRYLELGLVSPAGARWAIDNSFQLSWALLAFSIWADIYLFGEDPFLLGERLIHQMTP